MHGAVRPRIGNAFSLLLPQVRTAMTSFHPQELPGHLAGCRCILAMDQAGWRLSRNLDVPGGVKLVHTPAHTPEPDPVERLRHVLKR
jgi:hypothetical protein